MIKTWVWHLFEKATQKKLVAAVAGYFQYHICLLLHPIHVLLPTIFLSIFGESWYISYFTNFPQFAIQSPKMPIWVKGAWNGNCNFSWAVKMTRLMGSIMTINSLKMKAIQPEIYNCSKKEDTKEKKILAFKLQIFTKVDGLGFVGDWTKLNC